jgi:hypothetical protein
MTLDDSSVIYFQGALFVRGGQRLQTMVEAYLKEQMARREVSTKEALERGWQIRVVLEDQIVGRVLDLASGEIVHIPMKERRDATTMDAVEAMGKGDIVYLAKGRELALVRGAKALKAGPVLYDADGPWHIYKIPHPTFTMTVVTGERRCFEIIVYDAGEVCTLEYRRLPGLEDRLEDELLRPRPKSSDALFDTPDDSSTNEAR